MMRRALGDPAVHGGEASMAGHLRRIEQGDRRHIAIPVFVLRNFVARDIYVKKGGTMRSLDDLHGKRIGMFNWVASGTVWYRHYLRSIGVALDKIEWWVGDCDVPSVSEHAVQLPPGVRAPAPGGVLSDLLLAGEIDALINPFKPARYDPARGPIVRLVADIRAADRAYFTKTRVYPPQHVMIMRREAWEKNKWLARGLTDAFDRAGALFNRATRQFPYVSPWLDTELEETVAVMGEDFFPVGYEKNRAAMEAFCQQAYEVGITGRRIQVEEYFQEFLES
jgi:4,5-dihydroxyphthalate decarboxylase